MKEQVAAGLFLEHAEVHGNMYGTSLAAVAQVSSQGKHCVLDIDVQGARLVGNYCPLGVFILSDPYSSCTQFQSCQTLAVFTAACRQLHTNHVMKAMSCKIPQIETCHVSVTSFRASLHDLLLMHPGEGQRSGSVVLLHLCCSSQP